MFSYTIINGAWALYELVAFGGAMLIATFCAIDWKRWNWRHKLPLLIGFIVALHIWAACIGYPAAMSW